MIKITGFAAFFISVLLCAGCNGCGCIDALYSFNAHLQIIPDYDSIHVGDTIFLVSTIPVELQDQVTGATINYSNAKTIGSDIRISRLENDNPVSIDAVPEFDYFSTIGNIYNDRNIPSPNGVQQLTYEKTNEGYQLKVGIIAKHKGVYTFGIGNGLSNGRKDVHSCEKASFDISIIDTNQHFYLFYLWRPDLTIDDYYKSKIYYFKVY